VLGRILPAEAFGFLLITIRLAALVMVMPVLGDHTVPRRTRVAFALALSLVIYPSLKHVLPPMPDSIIELAALFIRELTIGLMMGLVTRILLTATHTAGSLIAFTTGLSAAQSFDPSQGSQSAMISTFMTLMAVTMIGVTDMHHLLIMGMVNSYQKFPVGMSVPYTDFAMVTVHYVSWAFMLGVQLAMPFMVYGFVYYLGLGLISRMIQGFQVFFVGMPVNLFFGFALLMMLLGSIINVFLDRFGQHLVDFVG